MKGSVSAVTPTQGGPWVATVRLEDGRTGKVTYWPELLEQWGVDALRAHLVQQADAQTVKTGAADPLEAHRALLGDAEAAVVCRKGEIGCTDAHPPPAEQGPDDGATMASP